jgi:hypothetical protein
VSETPQPGEKVGLPLFSVTLTCEFGDELWQLKLKLYWCWLEIVLPTLPKLGVVVGAVVAA